MKKAQDIAKAERERKVRDLWKVYNPTSEDFVVVLNSRVSPEVWTIKSKTKEIVPMYVMDKYFNEMSDRIIYNKSDQAVIEENEKRMAKGFNTMNLHTEQARFESRKLKSMMTKKDQLKEILVLGLYKEYGIGENADYQKNIDKRSFTTDDDVDSILGLQTKPKDTPPKEDEAEKLAKEKAEKERLAKIEAEKSEMEEMRQENIKLKKEAEEREKKDLEAKEEAELEEAILKEEAEKKLKEEKKDKDAKNTKKK